MPDGRGGPSRLPFLAHTTFFGGPYATIVRISFTSNSAYRRRHRHLALRPLRLLPQRRFAAGGGRVGIRRVGGRLPAATPAARTDRPAPRRRPLRSPSRCRRAVCRQSAALLASARNTAG